MELLRSIVAGSFDVLLHASLFGTVCLLAGWKRSAFDRQPGQVRLFAWIATFAAMAAVAMLAPMQPLPGLRLEIRDAILALAVVFGGPLVGGVVAICEILILVWLGGPLALTGAIGIGLSMGVAVVFRRRLAGREPTLGQLALLGLLTGLAGPAVSIFTHDPIAAWAPVVADGVPQIIGVLISVLAFATIIQHADRVRCSIEGWRERESGLIEANQRLSDLTVRLERQSEDYAAALDREQGVRAEMDAIFRNAPHGISFKDLSGRFVALNEPAARGLDRPAANMIGLRAVDLMSPYNAERSLASDRVVVDEGKTVELEYQSASPTAPEWLWTVKFPIRDPRGAIVGIGGFDIDISDRKRQEMALKRTALQLRRVQQITRIIHWLHRDDAKTGHHRDQGEPDDFYRMTGWRVEDVIDRDVFLEKCVHPLDRARMRETYRAFAARETDGYVVEFNLVRADNQIMPVKVWVERVEDLEGGDSFTLGAMQDVSEQHAREVKLAEATAKAEMSDRSKTEFLANLSHELRTPLNAVIGFTELLKMQADSTGDARTQEYLGIVLQSGQNLLAIIDDLLEISRIDFDTLEEAEARFALDTALSECLSQIEERYRDRQMRFTTHRPESALRLRAAEPYVRQALTNVLDNAVKFSSPGGPVDIRVSINAADELEIAVEDSGCGIEPELLPVLATPFMMGESAYARRYGGVGLGLAMCKKILDLHGGRMTINSAPGSGTRVALIFPAQRLG